MRHMHVLTRQKEPAGGGKGESGTMLCVQKQELSKGIVHLGMERRCSWKDSGAAAEGPQKLSQGQ